MLFIDILFLLFIINFINYILITDLKKDIKVNFKLVNNLEFNRSNNDRFYLFKNINFNPFNKTLITKWDFEYMFETFLYEIDELFFKYPDLQLEFYLTIYEMKDNGLKTLLVEEILILNYNLYEPITPEYVYNLINHKDIYRISNSSNILISLNKIVSPTPLATINK